MAKYYLKLEGEEYKSESSLIEKIFYDEITSLLFVEFKKGGVYVYCNVPKETYDDLIYSDSLGQSFARNIKNNFPVGKLGIKSLTLFPKIIEEQHNE